MLPSWNVLPSSSCSLCRVLSCENIFVNTWVIAMIIWQCMYSLYVLPHRTVRHTFAYSTFNLFRPWPLWDCTELRHLTSVNLKYTVFISVMDEQFLAYFCTVSVTMLWRQQLKYRCSWQRKQWKKKSKTKPVRLCAAKSTWELVLLALPTCSNSNKCKNLSIEA